MKVEFSRSGGVAGIRLTATLDTEMLPREEAERLRRLIVSAALFDLPASLKSTTLRPDQFQYRVAIEDGTRVKKVEMDEASIPEIFQPLLDYLVERARAARKIKRS